MKPWLIWGDEEPWPGDSHPELREWAADVDSVRRAALVLSLTAVALAIGLAFCARHPAHFRGGRARPAPYPAAHQVAGRQRDHNATAWTAREAQPAPETSR